MWNLSLLENELIFGLHSEWLPDDKLLTRGRVSKDHEAASFSLPRSDFAERAATELSVSLRERLFFIDDNARSRYTYIRNRHLAR